MIEQITTALYALAAIATGGAIAYFSFKLGANTVWRAVDAGSRSELFGQDDSCEMPTSTEESDSEFADTDD